MSANGAADQGLGLCSGEQTVLLLVHLVRQIPTDLVCVVDRRQERTARSVIRTSATSVVAPGAAQEKSMVNA